MIVEQAEPEPERCAVCHHEVVWSPWEDRPSATGFNGARQQRTGRCGCPGKGYVRVRALPATT